MKIWVLFCLLPILEHISVCTLTYCLTRMPRRRKVYKSCQRSVNDNATDKQAVAAIISVYTFLKVTIIIPKFV